MTQRRKICVVTDSRAEYGLLYWLMKEIQVDTQLQLQLIVTGAHLSPEFGLTVREIEKDGFQIDERVETVLSGDTPTAIARSMGLATIGIADALARLNPDLLLILGDRFEILAAAQAALISRVPVAHLHGGEATEGLIDEGIRHAVTKMSHLHFVSAEVHRRRVIQLGENPDRVFNFGAPGLDYIVRQKLLDRKELEEALEFEFGKTNFLVTYHPVTLAEEGPERLFGELLTALDSFSGAHIIFTGQNADTRGRIIGRMIREFVDVDPQRRKFFISLGQLRYLSVMRLVDVVIGNSSSALIEAPFIKCPTVNIGDRQRGRLRAESVIDCAEKSGEIRAAIEKALSPAFRKKIPGVKSPYGEGDSSPKIKRVLKTFPLENILFKKFFDQETTV
ncbi:MAG: UDP-N-acetylglucosamine 2-epimerase [Candidatus Glassbacteria bacterium]